MSDLVSLNGLKQAIRREECVTINGKTYIPLEELELALLKAAAKAEDN